MKLGIASVLLPLSALCLATAQSNVRGSDSVLRMLKKVEPAVTQPQPEVKKPEDNKPEDNKPEDKKPEDKTPAPVVCSSAGKTCYANEQGPEGSERYKEIDFLKTGLVCCDDEECLPEGQESPGSSVFMGECVPSICAGKQKEDKGEGTHRVTICHRTCSETNPWVRITIDDDAWNDSGCGHQNHVITTCNGKDLSKWGKNKKDYLIKDHGFRKETKDDKEYWQYWERACPYVRGEACCNREDEECCGDTPDPPALPSISLYKTVHPGLLDSCTTAGFETLYVEDADTFSFCYEICNTGMTELCEFTLIDNATPNEYLWTENTRCLDPGECFYADPNPWAICGPLASANAQVTAVSDGSSISATDIAAVEYMRCKEKPRIPDMTGYPCKVPDVGWPDDESAAGPVRPSICYPKAMAIS